MLSGSASSSTGSKFILQHSSLPMSKQMIIMSSSQHSLFNQWQVPFKYESNIGKDKSLKGTDTWIILQESSWNHRPELKALFAVPRRKP
ncbi:hypothetical protein L6164_011758 [Bauhinia variegata]|uniref:Uncharacterized protein n=1 Tax=Bauhinia variegata TaxID=167791 RepID=A0ACB9P7A9_BAUVA|nr:hypothetical protein L6164_011758 [Bauhinia variegata]